jgi:hypothetical protein
MTTNKSNLDPFDRQELQILLRLTSDRDAAEVLKHEPGDVREQLLALENKLAAQLSVAEFNLAIAEDIRLGRTSQSIRDEIISKVGMMAYSRTPEMQARYDAAVARENGRKKHRDKNNLCVTVTGREAHQEKVLARAMLEMLQESDVSCRMPEESVDDNPYDGDSIEQLGQLRGGVLVIVQTSGAE